MVKCKRKDFVTGDIVKYKGKRIPELKGKIGKLTATNFFRNGKLAGAFFLQDNGKKTRISPVEIKLFERRIGFKKR